MKVKGEIMGQNYIEEVFSGDKLINYCPYEDDKARFSFVGTNRQGENIFFPAGEQLLSRHLLLLGGIGTGKTNTFNYLIGNVRNSLGPEDVMIIFDTKGDFYKEFYCPGDIVISNDERACGENGVDYWNIFKEIMIDGRVEENVLEIANSLFYEKIHSSSQPFFPNAAKDLFSAMLLHIVRSENLEHVRNNQDLRSIFNTFSVAAMKKILDKYPDLKAMRAYIEDEKSGQTLGIVAELQQVIREIFIGNFKKKGSLSLREIVRKKGGKVIFIEYDLGIGSMLTPIYKVLIDFAIKEALCRTVNEGNVFFMIDEFKLLPNLQHIDDGVNFGRSLGAKFAIGIQNIDQVMEAYGENLARSILSGFSTNIAFRVNDVNSREFIKNLFGRNIKIQSYLSTIQSRGLSEQIREGYVVEDADITKLQIGEAIIGTMGCSPFRFRFREYQSGFFAKCR